MEKEKTVKAAGLSKKNRRILIIFTSVFVGLVLLLGIVLGTVALVKNSRSVISYKGVSIDGGVANYLAMVCKYDFMVGLTRSGIASSDTDYFWNSEAEGGVTYGELLRKECDAYIKKVVAGSYIFDKNTSLTKADKSAIDGAVESVLSRYGTKSELNAEAEKLGFDYKDIKTATEMIYKYTCAKEVVFGYDAAALKGGSFDNECDEFFATYTHAKLLFIRTEDRFVTDPDTGEISTESLNGDERAEVISEIERIRYLISGEGDEEMSPAAFDSYISRWAEKDEMNVVGGYYLHTGASSYANLKVAYPEVVEAIYSTPLYGYAEVETSWGVCFIYKGDPTPRAYIIPSLDRFFSDFYTGAAEFIYHNELISYSEDMKIKDSYYEIDPVYIPYNVQLIAKA